MAGSTGAGYKNTPSREVLGIFDATQISRHPHGGVPPLPEIAGAVRVA